MEMRERLAQILREEYGITTMEELNKALKELGPLDITIFTAKTERSV